MKNLAGNSSADDYIEIELEKAKLTPIYDRTGQYEVPSCISAVIGDFVLCRAWRYWVAVAPVGKGMPLVDAEALNCAEYPKEHFDEYDMPDTYGEVIRVAGYAGGAKPTEWLYDGHVKTYHIDTQEGLNEFVRRVKKLTSKRK